MQTKAAEPPEAAKSGRGLFVPPALRYPAYRNYWFGTLASVLGFQMFMFGQLWLMHQLEKAPIFLGFVGLAQAAPAIALTLFGGVFADRVNRRVLIITTQVTNAVLILTLAVLTTTGLVRPWEILVIAFITGGVNAFDQPARQAIFPQLIERKVLVSAVALNSSVWQGMRIIAPAVAGFVIAAAGTHIVFFLAAAGFLVMAGVMLRLKVDAVPVKAKSSPLRDMADGLKFIKGHSVFAFLIGMTFFSSFLGMAHITLMPVFAVDILHQGAKGQGLLLSLSGLGALSATVWLSSRANFGRKGLLIIGSAILYGITIAAFALSAKYVNSFPLAMGLMLASGVFNSLYMVSVMSSLQMLVPDQMRGRVMGFFGMTYNLMPLGGLLAGAAASVIGTPWAVAIGAAGVAVFALGPALANKEIRNLSALLREHERATQQPVADKV